MSISARSFTVHLADTEETLSRASRRIFIHTDILKVTKLVAGDVLALASAQESEGYKASLYRIPVHLGPNYSQHFAVGVAWPVSDGSIDGIYFHRLH